MGTRRREPRGREALLLALSLQRTRSWSPASDSRYWGSGPHEGPRGRARADTDHPSGRPPTLLDKAPTTSRPGARAGGRCGPDRRIDTPAEDGRGGDRARAPSTCRSTCLGRLTPRRPELAVVPGEKDAGQEAAAAETPAATRAFRGASFASARHGRGASPPSRSPPSSSISTDGWDPTQDSPRIAALCALDPQVVIVRHPAAMCRRHERYTWLPGVPPGRTFEGGRRVRTPIVPLRRCSGHRGLRQEVLRAARWARWISRWTPPAEEKTQQRVQQNEVRLDWSTSPPGRHRRSQGLGRGRDERPRTPRRLPRAS